MLWELIRSTSKGTSNEYLYHMFSCRNKKNIHTFLVEKSALSGPVLQSHNSNEKPQHVSEENQTTLLSI